MFMKMAGRVGKYENGIPDKVLQKDLVPDWSAAEVTTGVSILSIRLIVLNYVLSLLCSF